MNKPPAHTKVEVTVRPDCDFCLQTGKHEPAHYDGKTTYGPWANMCRPHFRHYGIGLGLGQGQELVLRKDAE